MKIKIHITLDELKEFYLKNNSNIINPGNFSVEDVVVENQTTGSITLGGGGSYNILKPNQSIPCNTYTTFS